MRNAYNMTPTERKRAFRVLAGVTVFALVVLAMGLSVLSSKDVSSDSGVWEAVVAARLVVFRAMLAVPAAVSAVVGSILLFTALDRSSLGVRLFHWADGEGEHVKAAKTSNAGIALGALILGTLALLAGVLR